VTIPSPYHSRTAPLCESLQFKDWAGYHAVVSYDTCHEREYFAFREAAGLIDVSPLFKYRIEGPDALRFLDHVVTRSMTKVKLHQVVYTVWCDDRGKALDDGTIARLGENSFRLTSAHPNLAWLEENAFGFEVEIEDVTESLCALSLQGPRSREILDVATGGAVTYLRFFRHTTAELGGVPVEITRTGYTGDLGYEVWADPQHAETVWDAIMEAGQAYRILPAGLAAMDVTRIEAGFVLLDVDYNSARGAMIREQESSPFEIGLGWTVHLDKKGEFVGRRALEAELAREPEWKLMGLVCDWSEIEALFARFGLPPSVGSAPWRDGRPVYASRSGRQCGRATSGTWSPMLKQNIALATIEAPLADPGQKLYLEMTVEYERHRVGARVVETPFFNPPRKTFTPKNPAKKKKAKPAADA
jgi:aminomethyltransferase